MAKYTEDDLRKRFKHLDRAARNREVRRESLREQLQSSGYLQEIHGILDELRDRTLSDTDIKRLNARINSYFRLLAKTLPDVKAVELEATFQEAPKTRQDLESFLSQVGLVEEDGADKRH